MASGEIVMMVSASWPLPEGNPFAKKSNLTSPNMVKKTSSPL